MSEKVLCCAKVHLPRLEEDFHKGVIGDREKINAYRSTLFGRPPRLVYLDRARAEQDESFVQIIPYVVVFRGREAYTYLRSGGGEKRLHGKLSLGLGGHINPGDGPGGLEASYEAGFRRELAEELGLTVNLVHPLGSIEALIYDGATAVGRVHFGVVHFLRLGPDDKVSLQEGGMTEGRWVHTSELRTLKSDMEAWSRLLVERFFG